MLDVHSMGYILPYKDIIAQLWFTYQGFPYREMGRGGVEESAHQLKIFPFPPTGNPPPLHPQYRPY